MFLPYIVVALFGLIFGSFLNVCIARLPKHESIVTPRSHCPRCNRPIQWYDNIPVVSYLLLRARCRHCHEPISAVYPLVEFLSGALLVITFAKCQISPEFIKYALLGMLLLIIIFTDLIGRRVPHAITLFGIGAGLLLSLVVPVDNRPLASLLRLMGFYPSGAFDSLLGSVAGALAGGGLFYAVGEAFYQFSGRKKEYLGFGDVMLMLMVGTFLGAPLTLLTILLGSLAGTFVAVPMTLINLNDLLVEFDFDEQEFAKLHLGQKCIVTTDAYPDRKYAASITEIASYAEGRKASVHVSVKVSHPDEFLRPKMNAMVTFLSDEVNAPATIEGDLSRPLINARLGDLKNNPVLAVRSGKTLARPRFRNYEWPYGTFLGAAAIFSSLEGQAVLDWYLRWSGLAS